MRPADKDSALPHAAIPPSEGAALAEHLIELSEAPLLAMDAAGVITMCNRAFADLLAESQPALRGRLIWDRLANQVAADDQRALERHWRALLAGEADILRMPLGRADGSTILVTFRCSRLGRTGAVVLLARVVEHQALLPTGKREARQFEVGVHERNRHHLRRDGIGTTTARTIPCYTEMHGRTEVCEGCPVFDGGSRQRVPVGQRKWVLPQSSEPGQYCLISFEPSETGWVRVTEVQLDDGTLSGLFRARLQRLAAKAQLTEREREVLELVCLGRAVDDVAVALGVTAHTVKFHQANMLKKLGVDSRLDILRLLM